MTLSFVIVSWNAREYLRQCLASIRENAAGFEYEVIVVDNKSDDGSPEAVEAEYPDVRLIRNQENLGFARANNIGIRASRGDYLLLVNSDVVILPDCIAQLAGAMERDQAMGIAGPQIIDAQGRQQPNWRREPGYLNTVGAALALHQFKGAKRFSPGRDSRQRHYVDIVSGCFWIIRRSSLLEVGLLDESFFMYGEDMDWCRRFRQSGWRVGFISQAQAIHYGGASSANAPLRFYLEMQKANYHYWVKHQGWAGGVFYRAVTILHQIIRLLPRSVQYLARMGDRVVVSYKIRRSLACIGLLLKPMEINRS